MKPDKFEHRLSEKLGDFPMMVNDPDQTFANILDLLEKKKKRRFGFWLWFGGGSLIALSSVLLILFFYNKPSRVTANNANEKTPASENVPEPDQQSYPGNTTNYVSETDTMPDKDEHQIQHDENQTHVSKDEKHISDYQQNKGLVETRSDEDQKDKIHSTNDGENNRVVTQSDSISNTVHTTTDHKNDQRIDQDNFQHTRIPRNLAEIRLLRIIPVFEMHNNWNHIQRNPLGIKSEKPVSFSIYPHVTIMGMKSIITQNPSANYFSDGLYYNKSVAEDRFMPAVQTGIGGRLNIKKYFNIHLGIDYSYFSFNQEVQDDSASYFVSSAEPGIYTSKIEALEIPFSIGMNIPIKKWSISADIGITPSFRVFTRFHNVSPGGNYIYEGVENDSITAISRTQLFLTGNILLNYHINDHFSVFAGVAGRYGLLSMYNEDQILIQHPFGIGGRFGFAYTFGK